MMSLAFFLSFFLVFTPGVHSDESYRDKLVKDIMVSHHMALQNLAIVMANYMPANL